MVTARVPGLEERSAKLTEEEGGVDNMLTVGDRRRGKVNMMILSSHILPCLRQRLEFVLNLNNFKFYLLMDNCRWTIGHQKLYEYKLIHELIHHMSQAH